VRQDEIVAVVPVPRSGAGAIVAHLGRAGADLQRRQVRLAVGVSTVHAGLREVPEAYAEAYGARSALGGSPGIVTLPQLSSFDYLTLRQDETARRIIWPEVRRFVEEDIAAGSGLVDTLVEYAALTSTPRPRRGACTCMRTTPTTGWTGSLRRPAAMCGGSPMSRNC